MVDSDRVRALFEVPDHVAPAVSPSGDAVAFRVADGDGTSLRLLSVESGATRTLIDGLPPVDQKPLYWLPSGEQLVNAGGTEDDQVVELVSRDGNRELLNEEGGRVFPYDTEPDTVWYWVKERVLTLYRHPVGGKPQEIVTVDPIASFLGGVDGDRIVITRFEQEDPAPHIVDIANGREKRLKDAEGWTAHSSPWIDDANLLLSKWGASNNGGLSNGIGVYNLETERFAWQDVTIDHPITELPNGDILAIRDFTPVVGGRDSWTELPVVAAVVSPMAADEILFPDGSAVIPRKSDTRPRELLRLNLKTGGFYPLVLADFAPLNPESVASPETVKYPTADGTEIDGYLWKPEGDEPFPAVVKVYPSAADPTPGLDWRIQLLVDEGYAVLYAGNRGDVFNAHRDYAAAGEWLANQPEIDSEQVACYGHSHGGEAALRQAFRHPETAIEHAKEVGEFSREHELEAGDNVLTRDDEYLISRKWLVDHAQSVGFDALLAEPVNAVGDGIVLLRK